MRSRTQLRGRNPGQRRTCLSSWRPSPRTLRSWRRRPRSREHRTPSLLQGLVCGLLIWLGVCDPLMTEGFKACLREALANLSLQICEEVSEEGQLCGEAGKKNHSTDLEFDWESIADSLIPSSQNTSRSRSRLPSSKRAGRASRSARPSG